MSPSEHARAFRAAVTGAFVTFLCGLILGANIAEHRTKLAAAEALRAAKAETAQCEAAAGALFSLVSQNSAQRWAGVKR